MSRRGAAPGGEEGPRPADGEPAPQASRAQGARGAPRTQDRPPSATCPLCREAGGDLVWQGRALRIVLPDEPDFPGFTRVVWQAHVAEMTDLAAADRRDLMDAVWVVEATMRRVLAPEKINLASLGNLVPHLHWHVVPRWADDARFPGSPWSAVRADGRDAASPAGFERRKATLAHLAPYRHALAEALGASGVPGMACATIG